MEPGAWKEVTLVDGQHLERNIRLFQKWQGSGIVDGLLHE